MDWNQLLVTNAIAFVLGVLASLAAWWWVAISLRPELEVSSKICKTPDPKSRAGHVYRVKLRNPSSKRWISEVEVAARLRLEGDRPDHLGNAWILVIPIGRGTIFTAMDPGATRAARFQLDQLEGNALERLPQRILDRIADGTVSLEDLFSIEGMSATVMVAITASHEFSGFRRLFPSSYELRDIELGKFKAFSVDVVSLEDGDQYPDVLGE